LSSITGTALGRAQRWSMIRREVLRAAVAVLIALGVTFVIVWFTSKAPFDAFAQLLTAVPSRPRTVGLWLDDAAKLTITGLAFSLVFQARQFALGVQGQAYVGGLAATYVVMSPLGQTPLGLVLGIAAAMLAGAIYGFLPGIAKAKLGANEIVSSLMLNYIAIDLCNYLVRRHLAAPGMTQTDRFPDASTFPVFIANTRIDLSIVIAIVSVALVWFMLYRTSWGMKLRLVGHNEQFARYSGVNATFIMVSAMTAAGALGGLLGSMLVQGAAFGYMTVLFEGGIAFEGILVAIVARARPLAVPFVALAYGYLRQGAQLMNLRTDVPAEVIGVVTALIILLVASSFTLPGRRFLSRLVGIKTAPVPRPVPAEEGSK
jgi:general nucleoside transport system permease protein